MQEFGLGTTYENSEVTLPGKLRNVELPTYKHIRHLNA